MNKLILDNINLPIPNIINIGQCFIDSGKLTINTTVDYITPISNWIQIISNPTIPFNMENYVCDAQLCIDEHVNHLTKLWPCSVSDFGQYCIIEFIFNSYIVDCDIKEYVVKPYIKQQNKKELEKIEINKIMNELDDWLKNPQENWDKRFKESVK